MGYSIKVDHSKLNSAASAVETYNRNMVSDMSKADSIVTTVFANWAGEDQIAFKNKWDTVYNGDSTYIGMKKSLENYAKFLKGAANTYKNAQADAINRAQKLQNW